jgi:hypothetical protein
MTIMGYSLIDILTVNLMVSYVYLFSLLIVILSSVTLLVHLSRIFWWEEVPKGFWRAVFQTPIVRIALRTKAFWIMSCAILIHKVAEYFLEFK